MKLMLHACCGPCSLEPVRLLKEAGHDITVCYANSNIAPRAEYDKRLAELLKWADTQGIPVVELPYDNATWQAQVAGPWQKGQLSSRKRAQREHEGGSVDSADVASGSQVDESWNSGHLSSSERALQEDESGGLDSTNAATEEFVDEPWGKDHLSNCERVQQETEDRHLGGTEATSVIAAPREDRCRACYAQRLEEAAAYAQNHGFEALSTTLAVSPYQLSDVCREELQAAAARHGLACIWEDFRPYYPAATRRSRELGMYRQNYCGCAYSKVEAEEERAARKAQKAAAQQEREAELRAARAKRAERQAAFEAKQRRKREIRDSFRH